MSQDPTSVIELTKDDILGVDLGSQNLVFALLKPDEEFPNVLMNNLSNRTTPSLIGFSGDTRIMGEDSVSLHSRSEVLVVENIKRLQGFGTHSEADVSEFRKWSQCDLSGKKVTFPSFSRKNNHLHTICSLTSMLLKGMIPTAAPGAKKCVFTVPYFFSKAQREALFDAVLLAGYEPLGIANELTCAALTYLSLRPMKEEDPPKTIMFVDQGHTHTSAMIAKISKSEITVLRTASDPELGGFHLSAALNKVVSSRCDVDLASRPRSATRIKRAVEKAKHILSTIPETPIEVDAVSETKDFKTSLSRVTLVECAQFIVKRTAEVIRSCLDEAGISSGDLFAVEVIGGGLRAPFLQDALTEALPNIPISHSLDSASSIALGACLFGRNSVTVNDPNYVSVGSTITEEDKQEALATEAELSKLEKEVALCNSLINDLENYAYRTKRELDEKIYEEVITKEGKENVILQLNTVSGWLDEHRNEGSEVLQKKLNSLKEYTAEQLPAFIEKQEKNRREAAELLAQSANYKPTVNPNEKRPPRTKQEKLTWAQKRKDQGNKLISETDYENATARYIQGLAYLDIVHDCSPDEEKLVKSLKISLLSNLCLCYLKLDKPNKVVDNATTAIELEPTNVKVLFRRAQAYRMLNEYDKSLKDLTLCTQLEPENNAVKNEIKKVNAGIAKEKEKQKRMAQRMFSAVGKDE